MAVRLSFGTAGIRARLGDGDDELNLRTVRAVGRALCGYLEALEPAARSGGLCIGYDGRTSSREFARELTEVALAHGFVVRAFEEVVPTPLLAFATQHHHAALGLMVTASHNPPSDNGIKVYWRGGAQILPPHDAEIARRIVELGEAASMSPLEFTDARAAGQFHALGDLEQRAYLDAILQVLPARSTLDSTRLHEVAYSALHGVGSLLTHALTERMGVELSEVSSQAIPRPDLGGLESPNPEHAVALAELLGHAERTGASLAFCHDPDADRLAVAARDKDGQLRVLSGDEVGALLTDYLLSLEGTPSEVAVVSTQVSGSLAERIAHAYGAHFERTLTGFKWITQRGRALERESGLRYVFGYEEALGYSFGTLGDDKDGIAALYVLLQLARKLLARGHGLWDRLEQLARRHGLYCARQITVSAQGADGLARVQRILADLRTRATHEWLPSGVGREDFLLRQERADLLVFRLPEHFRICVRPSGTEPKLKFYLESCEQVAPDEPLVAARTRAERTLADLAARIQAFTA